MIKRFHMRPIPLLAASMASLTLLTPSFAEEAAAPEPADNASAFRAMGYAMASQLRLNIGFSEAELETLFEGMRVAAQGGDQPEDFQEAITTAQQIYMERMNAFQAEEQRRAAELADENKEAAKSYFAELEGKEGIQKTDSGLYYEMLVEGEGAAPDADDRVTVNYRGVLIDGREFDANEGAEFLVNRVVPGFSEGLQLLKEGGKIKLHIPSDLGYGDRPARPGSIIEPGHALIFEVELLSVEEVKQAPPRSGPPAPPPNMTPPPPPSGPPPGSPPPPPPNMKPPTRNPGAGS
jgi:FKBP-type peptidyl-prolyl cis-trans isomerase